MEKTQYLMNTLYVDNVMYIEQKYISLAAANRSRYDNQLGGFFSNFQFFWCFSSLEMIYIYNLFIYLSITL